MDDRIKEHLKRLNKYEKMIDLPAEEISYIDRGAIGYVPALFSFQGGLVDFFISSRTNCQH